MVISGELMGWFATIGLNVWFIVRAIQQRYWPQMPSTIMDAIEALVNQLVSEARTKTGSVDRSRKAVKLMLNRLRQMMPKDKRLKRALRELEVNLG